MNGWTVPACFVALVGCQKPAPTNLTNGGAATPAARGHTYHYSFDDTPDGSLPADCISVLGFGSGDFPRAVLKALTFRDFTLSFACGTNITVLRDGVDVITAE